MPAVQEPGKPYNQIESNCKDDIKSHEIKNVKIV